MQTWGFSFNLGTKVASRWSMYHCTTFMHRKWCKWTNIHNTNMMHAFVNSCMQKRRLNWLYLWSRWYYLGITKYKSLLKNLNIDFLLSSQTSDECFSLFMFTVLLPMYTYCLFFFSHLDLVRCLTTPSLQNVSFHSISSESNCGVKMSQKDWTFVVIALDISWIYFQQYF